MKAEAIAFAGLVLLLAACASGVEAPTTEPTAEAQPAPARLTGFLTPETRPDAIAIIPPPPREGDARNTSDWDIFRATRALEGGERWALAQADDSYRPAYLLSAFSCAVGADLTPQNSPALAAILARTLIDVNDAGVAAKDHYKRTRPFLHNPGNICIARTDGLAASYDYPSGHASLGFMSGLVIASLAPDRSTAIMARARAYGESRVACGLHNMSAVEASRTNAASVFAALQGNEDFTTQMTKARTEMTTARATAPTPDAAACSKLADLSRPLALQ